MENESLNQPTNNPVAPPAQPQPQLVPTSITNNKGFLPLVFGVIVLLVAVAGGAYYLGTQKNNSPSQAVNTNTINQNQPSPTQTTVYSSPSPANVTWKTESVQIQKETAVSGSENISLTFQLPSDWKLKTVAKTPNSNNMIKNCADYVLTNSDGMATLTVSPMCAGWGAEYSDWPQDAVTIKEEQNVGNDGHTSYTVRYFDTAANKYRYIDGEKGTSNKIMDATIVTYNKSTGNFLPLNVTLTYTGSDKDSLLAITDKIVSSLSAKTN